jgi:hypothetical protein
MKRTKWNPRKVLIASAGVASVNYAVAAGCNDGASLVANLVACPAEGCGDVGGYGGASVANLVAPPPAAGSGNFFGGNGGIGGDGGFAGASVANLVAPPPGGTPNLPDASTPNLPDASTPDASPDDAGARDAAPDGAA